MGSVDIIQDPNDPNSKKDASSTGPSPNAAPPSAGMAPSQPGSGSNTSSTGSGQATGQKAGSGFVNLQNVINANKTNQLGSTINQGIQDTANNVKNGVASSQSQFDTDSQSALGQATDSTSRQNLLDKITNYQAPSNSTGSTATGTVNTAGQGPNATATTYSTNPVLSDGDVSQFQRLVSGTYTGPQQLSNLDALQQQAQTAQQLGQNVSSSGGRQQLLQQFVGGHSGYSSGRQILDNLILGQTGAGDLTNAKQYVSGLGDNVQSAADLATQQAAANTSQAKQFGTDTKSLLDNAQQPILDSSSNALADAQAKEQDSQSKYQDILSLLSSDPISHRVGNAQLALTKLQDAGLVDADQYSQLNSLFGKGFLDTKTQANALYEQALKDPNAMFNGALFAGNQKFNPDDYDKWSSGNLLNMIQSGKSLTNQQAIDQGYIGPHYTSLSDLGVDPRTAIQSVLTNTKAQGLTQGAFLNPTQQAQLNAISQIENNSPNPVTANIPTYSAGSNQFSANNLLGQITDAERQAQSKENQYIMPTVYNLADAPYYYKGGIVRHADGSMPRLKSMLKKK